MINLSIYRIICNNFVPNDENSVIFNDTQPIIWAKNSPKTAHRGYFFYEKRLAGRPEGPIGGIFSSKMKP